MACACLLIPQRISSVCLKCFEIKQEYDDVPLTADHRAIKLRLGSFHCTGISYHIVWIRSTVHYLKSISKDALRLCEPRRRKRVPKMVHCRNTKYSETEAERLLPYVLLMQYQHCRRLYGQDDCRVTVREIGTELLQHPLILGGRTPISA